MKKELIYILFLGFLVACSSPRYSYNFDHYNYNAGKKKAVAVESSTTNLTQGPEAIRAEELTASAEAIPVVREETTSPATLAAAQAALGKKYGDMSKVEKKEFRKEVKNSVKAYVKAKRNGDNVAAEKAVKAMDNDLKLAIIFGAVGLTLTFFGGVNSVFWIMGVVAVVIGVVFLIKWLVRQ